MTLYPKLIIDALSNVRYPGTGKNIVEMGMVADDMRIDGNKVSFSIIFEKPTDPFIKSVIKAAEVAVNKGRSAFRHVGFDAIEMFADIWSSGDFAFCDFFH